MMTRASLDPAVALFEATYGRLPRGGRLADLSALLEAFSHLPYENLSKIIACDGQRGQPRLRSPEQVMVDHLALGTGGTCFSLTELLRQLLGAAGLASYPVMAHMRHGLNIHCALVVAVQSRRWLVDPGYLVRRPLPLQTGGVALEGVAPGAPVVVPCGVLPVPEGVPGGDFDLYTMDPDGPRWRYRFSDRAPSPAEFRAHWRDSFDKPAMGSLLATRRSEDDALCYLHNHKLRRIVQGKGQTQNVRHTLEEVILQTFGIHPEVTRQAVALVQARRDQGRLEREQHRLSGGPERLHRPGGLRP